MHLHLPHTFFAFVSEGAPGVTDCADERLPVSPISVTGAAPPNNRTVPGGVRRLRSTSPAPTVDHDSSSSKVISLSLESRCTLGSAAKTNCVASADAPPNSEASEIEMDFRRGALRLVVAKGISTPAKRASSRAAFGKGSADRSASSIFTIKPKTSSKVEKRGRLKPAAKQNKPHQCWQASCVTWGIESRAQVFPTNLWPFSGATLNVPRMPSSSPPRMAPLKSWTTFLPALIGRPS